MDRAEKFWDRLARDYDKTETNSEPNHKWIIANAKQYLNVSDSVLDYGCATGSKALELSSYVQKIRGIDISSSMIDTAEKKAVDKVINNVDFVHATIFDKALKKKSFDVIMAFNILHAVENNGDVLKRISELLRPGGTLLASIPCLREKMSVSRSLQLLFYSVLIKIGLVPNILTHFTSDEFVNFFNIETFEIVGFEKKYHGLTNCFIAARIK